ncbi:MAG: Ppx/GppA phosphatase family protein [Gammaproteobacteria bacterium]|nr:Ppx/GppA phosphatase family protein [Gammaproteobacteria bacterium]
MADTDLPDTVVTASDTYAALDLGSNSFHLLVARDQDGAIQVLDRHREMTRLAAGLESSGSLSQECIDLALASLRRISQRIRALPQHNVRIVGTNALRQAANRDAFISQAESILGHNIDVISGREEGRLIYAAVAQSVESRADLRLVIDIGGGSTELIAGHRFEPHLSESIQIGCISMTERWFKDGKLSASRMANAVQDMQLELEVVEHGFRTHGWELAVGTSGTILAVQNAIAQFSSEGITKQTLKELSRRLVCFGTIDNIDPSWCSSRRAQSLPGGIAMLLGLFKTLKLDNLEVSTGALREGLLNELVGRAHDVDIRERSVRALVPRFHIDQHHATLVARTALSMFDQLFPTRTDKFEDERQLLRWAAMLHEIGMGISHSAYHKHGAYLLENLDLPGFTLTEQSQLAWLVRTHRRRLQTEEPMPHGKSLMHLCVILRLAVTLRRNRSDARPADTQFNKKGDAYLIEIDRDWLNAHPLTRMDLEQESNVLLDAGVELSVKEI